jgi:hypothetical protein
MRLECDKRLQPKRTGNSRVDKFVSVEIFVAGVEAAAPAARRRGRPASSIS